MMIVYVSLVVMALWLAVVSFFLFKTRKHYQRLVQRTKATSIDSILDTVIQQGIENEANISELRKGIETLSTEALSHYQKLGFVRFNPFDRVGGNQSFVIALLDKRDTGIVINFLYTREGVRIYAKQVKEGKTVKHELSQEEQEAIKKAK